LDQLFTGTEVNEEPLVDLKGLQFEGAVEGAKLRRDLSKDLSKEGGVAPVAVTAKRIGALGGEEERFAFARAVSRLYEMTIEVKIK
jgi:predicted ATPase